MDYDYELAISDGVKEGEHLAPNGIYLRAIDCTGPDLTGATALLFSIRQRVCKCFSRGRVN